MIHAETLPPTAQSAYADLLASLLVAPLPARGMSWFTREIKERRYWYLQYSIGNARRSVYVGPDDPSTRALVERAQALQAQDLDARPRRERLAGTCVAAGAYAPALAEARVYEAISQAGLFELGGVLIGTHAFMNLGNQLGVRWIGGDARTEDIDIAHDPTITIAAPDRQMDLPAVLQAACRGVIPVPALNPKHPSTSFSIRGEALTVSLLTPARGRGDAPVKLQALNAAAEPLRFLEYVIDGSQPAAVPTAAGLLVRLPDAARFALHKLVVSQRRIPAFANKSRKDIAQAGAIISTLCELRPADLERAWRAAEVLGGKFMTQLRAATRVLEPSVRGRLRDLTEPA